jgi:NodT family efflux transporter outer membrane factor (OMF) lipoprotein
MSDRFSGLLTATRLRLTLTRSLAVVAAVLAAGCADMSGIAPTALMRGPAELGLSDSLGILGAEWGEQDFWRIFGDPQLDSLEERALVGSPSVQLAVTRLSRAQAFVAASAGHLLPVVGAGAEAQRDLYSAHSLYPPPLGGGVFNSATLQINASWELDFFGKNRAALDAAIGSAQAAAADAQAARLLLATSVARNYFQLARLGAQLRVAQATLTQREQITSLVKARLQAGLDTQLELRQSQGGLPEVRLQIESLQEQISITRNALASLVGEPALATSLRIPELPNSLTLVAPTEVPFNLLGRRADVVAARWRVESASRDTDVARGLFYPNINLSAYAGFSAIGLGNVLKSGSELWNVTPAISLPIFDGGRLRANLRAKTADVDAAVLAYNSTVLEAAHDVADQLATARSLPDQVGQQSEDQQAAEDAYQIARQRFKAGVATYLQVLSAENNVLTQQRNAIDFRARSIDNQVALWRSLGGGFKASEMGVVAPQGRVEQAFIDAQSTLAGQRPITTVGADHR